MITHYLPRFLLEQFRGDRLWEMDKRTRHIEARSVGNAGSGDDLWQPDIERELMGEHDDTASKILRRKVWGKSEISLTVSERHDLALWLALFVPRVPNTCEDLLRMRNEADHNPQIAVDIMYENRERALQVVRKSSPENYDSIIEMLGKLAGEEWILASFAGMIRQKQVNYLPDPKRTYDIHLRTASIERFAEHIAARHWTWLHSPRGFVIGDNPFCRWHMASKRHNYGLVYKGTEYTMPISRNLCLHMQRKRRRDTGFIYCNRERTDTFNHRQKISALTHVYSHSPELLNPQAKYGMF